MSYHYKNRWGSTDQKVGDWNRPKMCHFFGTGDAINPAGSTLLKISPERRLDLTIITNCQSVFCDKVMILIISAALDTF